MLNRGLLAIMGLVIILPFGTAYAANQFDGPWTGSVKSMGMSGKGRAPCPIFEGTAKMFIQNGTVMRGQVVTPKGTPPIHGTVADDGTFNGTVGSTALTGKMSGDTFSGQWAVEPVCPAGVNMTRTH